MLEFEPGSPFRSYGFRGDPQEGLLGPEMAGREPRALVFGLPPTIALVSRFREPASTADTCTDQYET